MFDWLKNIFVSKQPLWHVHHDSLLGTWEGGIEARRAQIIQTKPPEQRAIRLRLLQPVKGSLPASVRANLGIPYFKWDNGVPAQDQRAVEQLHRKECAPDCPMLNGKDEICPTG